MELNRNLSQQNWLEVRLCELDDGILQLHHVDGDEGGCLRAKAAAAQADTPIAVLHGKLHLVDTEITLRTNENRGRYTRTEKVEEK